MAERGTGITPSLAEVNGLLSRKLYDAISIAESAKDLLDLSKAVEKLNASLKGQFSNEDEDNEKRESQEEKDLFSRCAEGEVIDASITETVRE